MCTIECARCEETFTVSEELCGECDDALDDAWRERLGANFIAIGLAAALTMATFEITKSAHPRLDGFFAAAETVRLLRAMAGFDLEDPRVEKAGAP